jgi:hypothetical protein
VLGALTLAIWLLPAARGLRARRRALRASA